MPLRTGQRQRRVPVRILPEQFSAEGRLLFDSFPNGKTFGEDFGRRGPTPQKEFAPARPKTGKAIAATKIANTRSAILAARSNELAHRAELCTGVVRAAESPTAQ